MIRVALLAHGGFDEPGGGVSIPSLRDFVAALSRLADVTVFFPTRSLGTDTGRSGGDVRFVPLSVPPGKPFRLAARMVRSVRAEHQRFPFAILHGLWAIPSGFLAVAMGKRWNIPSVVSILGAETVSLPIIRYGHQRRWTTRTIVRWTCNHAGGLVTASAHQSSALKDAGITRTDAVCIPPAASAYFYSLQRQQEPAPPYRFLHVANLTEVKDQTTLLHAFSIISRRVPSTLQIVGGDYLSGKLNVLSRSLGLTDSVSFLGYLPPEEIPYARADILLHTSLHEAAGVVAAEAAAAGVLVCGTDVGTIHDLAPHGAVAVPTGDPSALASAVLSLLNEPGRCRSMRAYARNWADRNTNEAAARSMLQLYTEILDNRRRGFP